MERSFRVKNTKSEILNKKLEKKKNKDEENIDSLHKKTMKSFQDQVKERETIIKKIEKLEKEQKSLKNKKTVNKKIESYEKQLLKLCKKIDELKDGNIDSVKNEKVEGHIIAIEYTDVNIEKEIENLQATKEDIENKINELNSDLHKKQVIDKIEEELNFYRTKLKRLSPNKNKHAYFKNVNNVLLKYDKDKETKNITIDLNNKNAFREFTNIKNNETIEEYMSILKTKINKKNEIMCQYCKIPKIIVMNEGTAVCTICGDSDTVLLDPEKPNFKDQTFENKANHYVRSSHCTEVLDQNQGKETSNVTEEDMIDIIKELKIRGVKDLSELNRERMKDVLSSINKSHLYESTVYIIHKLNGIPVNTYSKNLTNIVKIMYKKAEEAWLEVKTDEEKNFLNTCFCFMKIFELLGEWKIAKSYNRLSKVKELEKLRTWEKICKQTGWPYLE